MRFWLLLTLALSFGVTATAQLFSVNHAFEYEKNITVVGEVTHTFLYKGEGPRISYIKVHELLVGNDVHTVGVERILHVKHSNSKFELFPGRHVLNLHRKTGGYTRWILDPSSHGEIVNETQQKRRRKVEEMKRIAEKKICESKVKQARDESIFTRKFNAPECYKHFQTEHLPEFNINVSKE